MKQTIPQTPFALLSGSASWGLKFPDDLDEPGIRVLERGLTFDTPWGSVENWQVIEFDGSITVDGKSRTALNVFFHGMPMDRIDHSTPRRVFWILEQAGVKKVLSDSTCGSLNRAIQPGDFVIANDIIQMNQTPYSLLPGRLKYLCRGAQMFCPRMGHTLMETASATWPRPKRVYGLKNVLIAGYVQGPRFETAAEAQAMHQWGADFVNQSIAPEATHAREIGACFISASYVTNFVDGIIPGTWGDLDKLHEEVGDAASRISLRAMARTELTDICGCQALRAARPAKYSIVGQAAS